MKVLADYGAELRMAFSDDKSVAIKVDQLALASEWLEREVTQETHELQGTFRGVTHESGHFDFKLENGLVITGQVDDAYTEENLISLDGMINKFSLAEIQETTVKSVNGSVARSYVLLSARVVESPE